MTDLTPEQKEECVRIVKEIQKDREHKDPEVGLTIPASHPLFDRIQAAVKPEGPFPVRGILNWTIGSGVGGEHLVGNLPPGVNDSDFSPVRITGDDMRRLVVAWLKREGVDLDCVYDNLQFEDPCRDNLGHILDAALDAAKGGA